LSSTLAGWYADSRLAEVLVVVSFATVIESARIVPVAVLSRSMAFKDSATIDFIRAVTQVVTCLSLAVLGKGYWALVIGLLSGSITATLFTFVKHPLRPAIRSFRWPRQVMARSRLLLVGHLAWHAYRNGDVVLVGKSAGSEALGYFSVARTLAWLPVEKLVTVLTSLTQSLFAHHRENLPELRRYLLYTTDAILLATLLPLAGLAATADIAVPLILGDKWTPAVPLLRILVVPAVLTGALTVMSQVAAARGGELRILKSNLISVVLTAAAYTAVASHFGLLAGAACWALSALLVFGWFARRTLLDIDLSVRQYAASWTTGGTATVAMLVVVTLVRSLSAGAMKPAVELTACILLGAAIGLIGVVRSTSPVARHLVQMATSRLLRQSRLSP
jgi:PST family polysaccharide transporter